MNNKDNKSKCGPIQPKRGLGLLDNDFSFKTCSCRLVVGPLLDN